MQLDEEKIEHSSIERNEVGFTKGDAAFFTPIAKCISMGVEPLERVWKPIVTRLGKYSTQLACYPDILALIN